MSLTTQQLPQIPERSCIKEREFRGRIEPSGVAAALNEILQDLTALYAGIDGLDSARQRLSQAELATISRLKLSGSSIEDRLVEATRRYKTGGAANTYTFNLFNVAEQELESGYYTLEPIQQDVDSGVLRLNYIQEAHYTPQATCRVEVASGPTAGSDPSPLTKGQQWLTSVWSSRRLLLRPDRWSGLSDGAAAWLIAEFPRPVTVNTVSLVKAGTYPLLVGPIYLYRSDRPGEIPLAVVGPDQPIWLESSANYILPDVEVKKVRLLVNQRHYLLRETDGGNWYEYVYGLKELQISYRGYRSAGEWISRPVETGVIIGAVSLEVDEERPSPLQSDLEHLPLTSTEYSILVEGDDRWQPILPSGYSKVVHELLPVRREVDSYTASLRFPNDGDVLVYKNGQLLMPGQDYLVVGNKVKLLAYQPGVYTASYTPKTSAYHALAVNERTCRQVTETFQGSDQDGMITLSCPPYMDWTMVNRAPEDWNPSITDGYYCPINVVVHDAQGNMLTQPSTSRAGQIYNTTPYTAKVPAAPNGVLTYQVTGRRLVFSRPLDGNHLVHVTYTKGPMAVRVRAVLRRHFDSYTGFTPVIRGLRLRFEGV